jgi:hypothetical protein
MAKQIKAGREDRFSALWGTTKRDGETRGSALWGNGGRGSALVLATLAALTIPLAAGAVSGSGGGNSGTGGGGGAKVQIPDALLSSAKAHPDQTFPVIVQGDANEAPGDVADEVAKTTLQADRTLDDAVTKADAGVDRARDAYAKALAAAQRARADALKAQADADAKAARAAASGKASAVAAAQNAAATAAKKDAAADAAEAAAASAKAALVSAQTASAGAHARLNDRTDGVLDEISDRFPSISGVAAQLTGSQLAALAQSNNGHIDAVTPDVPVVATGGPAGPAAPGAPADVLGKWSSTQAWVHATGVDANWGRDKDPKAQAAMPTIAVVDSGVEDRSDFDGRLLANVDLTDLPTGLDARVGAARQRRLAGVHAALGDVLRGADRLRRGGLAARPASRFHARPGQGRADGHGQADEPLGRPRRRRGGGRRRRRHEGRQGAEPEPRPERVRRDRERRKRLRVRLRLLAQRGTDERVLELGVVEQRVLELGLLEQRLVELRVLEQRLVELGVVEQRLVELGLLEQRLVELRRPRGRGRRRRAPPVAGRRKHGSR